MTSVISFRSKGVDLPKIGWLSATIAVLAVASTPIRYSGIAGEVVASTEQNFGLPSEGFQLSLKFAKDHFAEDEPIAAVLTTRNISDRQRSFPYVTHYVEFLVVDEGGKRVSSREELNPSTSGLNKLVTSGKEITLVPGQEHESRIDLRKYFDLPRGRFTVSATRKVPAIDDGRVQSQVMSGNATFSSAGFKPQESTIAPPQSSATNGNRAIAKTDAATAIPAVRSGQLQSNAADLMRAPETPKNVDVPTSFAQAEGGQSMKLYYVLGIGALLALAFCIWVFRRRKGTV